MATCPTCGGTGSTHYQTACGGQGGGTIVWNYWVDSSTATTTSTNTVWTTWTSSTTSSTDAWIVWANDGTGTVARSPVTAPALHYTPEQIEAIREADARRFEEAKARAKAQEAATKRALQLLRDHLTQKQRQDMQKRKFFLVKGGKTGKTYRVHTGQGIAGNIYELADNDNEKAVARYCVHTPYGVVPEGDNFLAQTLMLQYDEEALLKLANRTQIAA